MLLKILSIHRAFFLVTCCFLSLYSVGQSIKRSSIGVFGNSQTSNGVTVQSIAGQSSLTTTFHGFIQPYQKVKTFGERDILIAPNPTFSTTVITGVLKGDIIYVSNLWGDLVKVQEVRNSTNTNIDFSFFPSGVYLITVEGSFIYTPQRVIKLD